MSVPLVMDCLCFVIRVAEFCLSLPKIMLVNLDLSNFDLASTRENLVFNVFEQ